MSETNKADHVRAQKQTRSHVCHWPGCARQVPPAMWGCSKHWFTLPKSIRDEIWKTYKPGQEVTMRVSEGYVAAAKKAQQWIQESGR